MIYMFYRSSTDNKVIYMPIMQDNQIRKEIQHALPDVFFLYDPEFNDIQIINDYFDLLECTYYIFLLLNVYVRISELRPSSISPIFTIPTVKSYNRRLI